MLGFLQLFLNVGVQQQATFNDHDGVLRPQLCDPDINWFNKCRGLGSTVEVCRVFHADPRVFSIELAAMIESALAKISRIHLVHSSSAGTYRCRV